MKSPSTENSTILICGGFDPSGNAGLLRDSEILKQYGQAALYYTTSLTVQNNEYGLSKHTTSPAFTKSFRKLLKNRTISAVKIGMLGSIEEIKTVISLIRLVKKKNQNLFVVWDPIIESSSGLTFLNTTNLTFALKNLLPHCQLITPNSPELKMILRLVKSTPSREMTKRFVDLYSTPIYLKGGHLPSKSTDLLFDGHKYTEFKSQEIRTKNIRGTGCVLSTLICIEWNKSGTTEKTLRTAKKKMNLFLRNASKNQ